MSASLRGGNRVEEGHVVHKDTGVRPGTGVAICGGGGGPDFAKRFGFQELPGLINFGGYIYGMVMFCRQLNILLAL